MKRIEQLDAHVKSYRDYLKKKKREHIISLLKELQSQREYLLLGEHPVPRISYKFNMVAPAFVSPQIPDKVSFTSNIKLKKEFVTINHNYKGVKTSLPERDIPKQTIPQTPTFSLKKFKFDSIQINPNNFDGAVFKFTGISYMFNQHELDVNKFNYIKSFDGSIRNFTLPKSPNRKLKTIPTNTFRSNIYDFSQPKSYVSIKKWRKEPFKIEMPNFRLNSPHVSMPDLSKQSLLPRHFHVNPKTLYTNLNLNYKQNDVTIPQFNREVKIGDIKLNKKIFPEPDLDFTDVLAKFQRALNETISKDEQYEE